MVKRRHEECVNFLTNRFHFDLSLFFAGGGGGGEVWMDEVQGGLKD